MTQAEYNIRRDNYGVRSILIAAALVFVLTIGMVIHSFMTSGPSCKGMPDGTIVQTTDEFISRCKGGIRFDWQREMSVEYRRYSQLEN